VAPRREPSAYLLEIYNPNFQPLSCTPVGTAPTAKGTHTAEVDVALPDVPGPYTVLVRGLDRNGQTKKEKLLRDKWAQVAGKVVYVPLRIENVNQEHLGYDPDSSDLRYSQPHLSFIPPAGITFHFPRPSGSWRRGGRHQARPYALALREAQPEPVGAGLVPARPWDGAAFRPRLERRARPPEQ